MPMHRKVRSLKVFLSDEELQTLQLASTMSSFETQGDFIAASILATAEEAINSWRYTTTDVGP
jgi:hypothetical protein